MPKMETQPTAGHNSEARAEMIRNACRDLANMEAERQAIGKRISELKQKTVKGSLGMKISDFNMAYRLYGLEDDDRDQFIDTLRETFTALGIGAQLDWVDGVIKADASADPARVASIEKATFDGMEAGNAGRTKLNPHVPGIPEYEAWDKAYDAAQTANRAKVGKGKGAPKPPAPKGEGEEIVSEAPPPLAS